MRYVEVGGARVSVIGLGTWQFGSTEWGYGRDYNEKVAGEIVRRALELGINLVDTAEIYGLGRSERIVGEAIRGRREAVFLATKLFPIGLPFMTRWRARRSARRLGVERLDLYQQHWPSRLFPPRATMPRFRRLVDEGLVRHVGVSNHSLGAWQECDPTLPGLYDSYFEPFWTACERLGMSFMPYFPLASGVLSGKYQSSSPANFRRLRGDFSSEARTRREPLIAALREVAAQQHATPAQVALAWLVQKPNVVAIPGASSIKQLEENAAASEIRLSAGEMARLDA